MDSNPNSQLVQLPMPMFSVGDRVIYLGHYPAKIVTVSGSFYQSLATGVLHVQYTLKLDNGTIKRNVLEKALKHYS